MTKILIGDVRQLLRELPDNSVDAVVTSPPYWKLRDYGVEGQLGLERTPQEWVDNLVGVFAEVRRVLAPHGTLWLNVGDKHVSDGGSGHQGNANSCRAHRRHTQRNLATERPDELGWKLKPKDLCLLPARLAVALQEDGWYVRQRAIWHKPSPMPESTRDRPTTDYEDILMLTKRENYFYDSFGVMQETTGNAHSRGTGGASRVRVDRRSGVKDNNTQSRVREPQPTRNLRAVWRLPARPFAAEKCLACGTYFDATEKRALERGADDNLICTCGRSNAWLAHFATFPSDLPEMCLRASVSAGGYCVWCGAPLERIVKRAKVGDWHPHPELKHKPGSVNRNTFKTVLADKTRQLQHSTRKARAAKGPHDSPFPAPEHAGWKPCCPAAQGMTRPGVVLDPFGGAFTTAMVAERMGYDAVVCELNPQYAEMGRERLMRDRDRR